MAFWSKPRRELDAEALHFVAVRAEVTDAEFQLDFFGVELPERRPFRRLRCFLTVPLARQVTELLDRHLAKRGPLRVARESVDIANASTESSAPDLYCNNVLVWSTENELVIRLGCHAKVTNANWRLLREVTAFTALPRGPAVLAAMQGAVTTHKQRFGSFA